VIDHDCAVPGPKYPGRELIGGFEHRKILIADYSQSWPERFERERARIARVLGPALIRIDHIGSTSIPGLAAKPIVDIQASVPDVEDDDQYMSLLESIGYVLRLREADHRMLRTPAVTVHVHICSAGSDWERRHLLFRDWLRADERDRRAYEALKRQLAVRDWPDVSEYTAAKTDLVAEIAERAEAWARVTGWSVAAGR
jgi:GrpB-like predicted nucleotidyltransferase (UPF0157 family)